MFRNLQETPDPLQKNRNRLPNRAELGIELKKKRELPLLLDFFKEEKINNCPWLIKKISTSAHLLLPENYRMLKIHYNLCSIMLGNFTDIN